MIKKKTKAARAILLFWFASLATTVSSQTLDSIVFGDTVSETAHSLSNYFTITVTNASVSPAQIARRCQSISQTNIYGGNLNFALAVDSTRRNYFSLKLWGGDDNSAVLGQVSDMGRLYLYVPIAQF